jgi:hypothetical protein
VYGHFLVKYYTLQVFLPMTTPKSNPSKHYKHFRKAIAFPFRKLELQYVDTAVSGRGHFRDHSSRIQVLAHMPCWRTAMVILP